MKQTELTSQQFGSMSLPDICGDTLLRKYRLIVFFGSQNWGERQLKCLSSYYELPGKSRSCFQVNLTSYLEHYILLSAKNLVCPQIFSSPQFVLWQANCWHCIKIAAHCLKRRKTAGKCHKHISPKKSVVQNQVWFSVKPILHIKENLKQSGWFTYK